MHSSIISLFLTISVNDHYQYQYLYQKRTGTGTFAESIARRFTLVQLSLLILSNFYLILIRVSIQRKKLNFIMNKIPMLK